MGATDINPDPGCYKATNPAWPSAAQVQMTPWPWVAPQVTQICMDLTVTWPPDSKKATHCDPDPMSWWQQGPWTPSGVATQIGMVPETVRPSDTNAAPGGDPDPRNQHFPRWQQEPQRSTQTLVTVGPWQQFN